MAAPLAVTAETFEQEVLRSELPVVVDFWAEWCVPCRMIAPVLEELADAYDGRLRFVAVDTDANPELSRRYGILSIPTLYVFHGGELVRTLVGAREKLAYTAELDATLTEIAAA
ncbi:thioredoxin [Cellulomonas hominis]|uniref:Thioredoxin n=1 Tax=Cellulomonas hominis TaxID=156981 RepID=A0A511FK28_9CELL|nr:thioredoxin [Cellulomonas hominis]MBB5472937.1 thioredoxin [Cellulomonas hominis]MBU5422341.1 thioredoxin [Cellulomonas hominis]NKY06175.1 thioredoxin [Cellulomonas hominis]NKY11911.1 thioredoxin [Cellulomonas hominis]GEL48198.1 thioredoxin [Cellulomonas hominis]